MGCCGSAADREPLLSPVDPLEAKFNSLFVKGDGVIPTRDVAKSMGVSAVTMGRMVGPWGYQVGRRYVGGKRERVIVGLVPK